MPALRHRAAHFALKKMGMFNRRYSEAAFGREFVIPIINGRKTYVSEPWMAEVIARLFRETPGGFVDVGVNLGQTMLKVAAADPTRPYVGFEPNPACADYASELSLANAFGYVVVPAGLGAKTTVARLQIYRDEPTDPSASMVEGFRDNAIGTKAVTIIAAEDLPGDLLPEQIAIVKIDVEGGEAEVIEGLEPLLRDKRPYVLVEILPAYTADNAPRLERQQRIEGVLRRCGYAMFRILRENDEGLKTLEPIDTLGIHGDLALSDYIMAPSERSEAVMRILAKG